MTEERVMVFIDGGNFYHGMKEMLHRTTGFPASTPFNFYKFARLLAKNRRLIRLYYYTGIRNERENPEKFKSQKGFFDQMRRTPFCTLRLGRIIKRGDSYVEKGVDVLLTVDMIRLARLNNYDTAILVSGDGDFVEAVKDVVEMGRNVELAYFPFDLSMDLRNTCDRYTELTPTLLSLCTVKTMPETMMAVGK
jgi:uncharacterized LabA/DUF88 family protein